jgi:hypothetical protein
LSITAAEALWVAIGVEPLTESEVETSVVTEGGGWSGSGVGVGVAEATGRPGTRSIEGSAFLLQEVSSIAAAAVERMSFRVFDKFNVRNPSRIGVCFWQATIFAIYSPDGRGPETSRARSFFIDWSGVVSYLLLSLLHMIERKCLFPYEHPTQICRQGSVFDLPARDSPLGHGGGYDFHRHNFPDSSGYAS